MRKALPILGLLAASAASSSASLRTPNAGLSGSLTAAYNLGKLGGYRGESKANPVSPTDAPSLAFHGVVSNYERTLPTDASPVYTLLCTSKGGSHSYGNYAESRSGGATVTQTLVVDSPTTLTLAYKATGSGMHLMLGGPRWSTFASLTLRNASQSSLLSIDLTDATSGIQTATATLVPGTYTLTDYVSTGTAGTGSLSVSFAAQPVPEPAPFAALAMGALALSRRRTHA